MSNFRLSGNRYLLTWPKSGALTFQIIKTHIKSIAPYKYLVVSREMHADGEEHFHAVVLFEKKIYKRVNVFTIDEFVCNIQIIGKTNANLKRSINYVKKEGVYVEYGEMPEALKKLDKKEKVMYVVEHTNKQCAESGYFNFTELRHLDYIRSLYNNAWPNFQKRRVYWFYGGTGTGKTREAWEILTAAYERSDIWCNSGKMDPFFLGYTGQQGVILDDFRPGTIRFEMLLRILDGYPVIVNIKGGQTEWLAKTIIITAPTQPTEMYVNRETGQEWDHLDQLIRRIDDIREFTEDTEIDL